MKIVWTQGTDLVNKCPNPDPSLGEIPLKEQRLDDER